jgi:hypothetical protein
VKSIACLVATFALSGCGSSTPAQTGRSSGSPGQISGSTGGGSGAAAGSPSGAASGDVTSGTGSDSSSGNATASGNASGSVTTSESGLTTGAASGSISTGAASGSVVGVGAGDASLESSTPVDGGPVALPDGSVMGIPAGYAGAPFKGVMAQIPGTVYARNYDVGGEGVAFHHPGAITCGDWPAGMPLYRTGADCVGLSVTTSQKPDITTTGAPAPYGEIYVSYTGAGQWMKYTVEVTQSATYVIGGNYATGGAATDPVGVVISFALTPTVSSGDVDVPTTADHNHESYHVWETLGLADNIGEITVSAGTYVMTFAIASSNGNFDTFTFTPKP